jgi:hypothetical protein
VHICTPALDRTRLTPSQAQVFLVSLGCSEYFQLLPAQKWLVSLSKEVFINAARYASWCSRVGKRFAQQQDVLALRVGSEGKSEKVQQANVA